MNSIKEVQSQKTLPPFSWQNKVGVTSKEEKKLKECSIDDIALHFKGKLPPPPCPPEKFRDPLHDNRLPPPPCAFQLPLGATSRRGLKKDDDPFYIAYKECTKDEREDFTDLGIGLKRSPVSALSCKRCCGVVEGSIVKASHSPKSRSFGKSNGD